MDGPTDEHSDFATKILGFDPRDANQSVDPDVGGQSISSDIDTTQNAPLSADDGTSTPADGGTSTPADGGTSDPPDGGISEPADGGTSSSADGGTSAKQPIPPSPPPEVAEDDTPALVPGQSEFGYYFSNCMAKLGLPAPTSFFTSSTAAVATVAAIEKAVTTFGTEVTIGELVGAGLLSEVLLAAGACTASAYAGACTSCAAGAGLRTLFDV
jgi:hypothetical protein